MKQKLTKAEEQVMKVLWSLEKGFVKEIIERFKQPKPAYNTVSTIVRILEQKGFVAHEAFGKTHRYYPLVSKNDYSKGYFKNFLSAYFSNSFQKLLSFFSTEEDLSLQELQEMKDMLEKMIAEKENKNE